MDVNQIKVYLLTGFLGAGKTTVLNNLLGMMPDKRNVVIENEFGKASVDGSLITQSYSELYELSNGCICCWEQSPWSLLQQPMHTSDFSLYRLTKKYFPYL